MRMASRSQRASRRIEQLTLLLQFLPRSQNSERILRAARILLQRQRWRTEATRKPPQRPACSYLRHLNILPRLLAFPAHAVARVFQNDTVRGQLVADAIGFREIFILFCGHALRYQRIYFFVAGAARL